MRGWLGLAAVAIAIGTILPAVAGAADKDQENPPNVVNSEESQNGYYYPELTSREVYTSRATPAADVTRATRLAFVTTLTQQQLGKPYAPTYAIFAKGNDAEKLIIVSLGDNGFRTVYQARALLAQLTAVVRTTPLVRELKVDDIFTFFDLARLLGFTEITISDGETFAHQIKLE
ncbi:MAG TPA: hypothetical protein VMU42_19870 [Candidatus Sulfotelmatobacter sp.]|nr:hypothetical protein [Candidatus Sulfotelmatobacter sp.]